VPQLGSFVLLQRFVELSQFGYGRHPAALEKLESHSDLGVEDVMDPESASSSGFTITSSRSSGPSSRR